MSAPPPPPGPRKPSAANKNSILLSREENEALFKLLGPRCQTLATAVVQLFGTEAPHHNSWIKRHCGVATFTKDNNRRSYYIQVYDIVAGEKRFEQELYNQFQYSCDRNFFHQFEGEVPILATRLQSRGEGPEFKGCICECIKVTQADGERRRMQNANETQNNMPLPPTQPQSNFLQPQQIQPTYLPQAPSSQSKENNNKKQKKKNKQNKNKLCKEQIGAPMDFKHVTHVGFDPDKGLSHFNVDDKLQGFFDIVGVSEQQLSDTRTREFIYDFIEKNGGIEKAVEETQRLST
ncbi:unnamed protein product, partial [Meganyctiphanes norvegica]